MSVELLNHWSILLVPLQNEGGSSGVSTDRSWKWIMLQREMEKKNHTQRNQQSEPRENFLSDCRTGDQANSGHTGKTHQADT